MKGPIILAITVMIFTGCAVLTPQEMQQERLRLLEAYDEARQRHNPEKVKQIVKELLVGEWQYVGLEVEAGSVSAKEQDLTPQQALKSATTFVQQLAKSATGEAALTDASEQTEEPSSPRPKTDEQVSPENATRLPGVEVTDKKPSQRILGAKVALVASTRKNLTLEFFEESGSYHYRGSNQGKRATGQCYITTKRFGDDSLPLVRFNQRTGPELLEFLFGSEPVRQIAAKQKQKRATLFKNRQMGIQGARKAAARQHSFSIASMAGITVREDTLYLTLYGDMTLTPKGWMRTGGIRCTFKRIE